MENLERRKKSEEPLEALNKNEKIRGETWFGIWRNLGGEINRECKDFFEGRDVSISEAKRFFIEEGEFTKPDEKKIKELKEAGKEEEAGVEIIQSLPLPAGNRVELLLCFLGEKQATTLMRRKQELSLKNTEGFAELLKRREEVIKENLNELNLFYETEEYSEKISEEETQSFHCIHISKDKDILERLVKTWEEEEDKEKKRKKEEQRGLLYGYPKTAVKAWGKSKTRSLRLSERWKEPDSHIIRREEVPKFFPEEKRKKIESIVKFANFNFSRKHWKKELNELRKKVEKIREKAPELYEEFLSSKTG